MADREPEVDVGLRCIWGIILVVFGLLICLSLFSYDWQDIYMLKDPPTRNNLIGPVGAWLSYTLFLLLGIGAYLVPVWCFLFGGILFVNREERLWPKALLSATLVLSLALATELQPGLWADMCRKLNISDTGGILGRLLMAEFLIRWLQWGAAILVWSGALVSLVWLVGVENLARLGVWLKELAVKLAGLAREAREQHMDRRELLEEEQRRLEKERRRLERAEQRSQKKAARERPKPKPKVEREPEPEPEPEPTPEPIPEPKPAPAPKPKREPAPQPEAEKKKLGLFRKPKEKPAPREELVPAGGLDGPYELPPLDIFTEFKSGSKSVETDSGTTSRVLIETLSEFGIEVEVANVERGPVVTRYELLPAPGVRVERIGGLSNNLALALKATSVRVQAPVPGKGVVGIEVPNATAKLVSLRGLLEGEVWANSKAHLPLALGQDVGGNDLVADLAEMPHMLVAGATGAGKTVCMNSLLAGLLMSRTPQQLRLMLVDPKIVEFSVYNHLPHLVVPVITDPKKVALGLRWAINEMESRYKLFAKVGVRNIASYNSREIVTQDDLFSAAGDEAEQKKDTPPPTIPYIVIVIDELADLMLADGAEIENCVARLAQLSRAVGIHMILSTQRPSVNVITGTIKANFPARIAFQVAQKVDSRTILDMVGADKLLGRGDMLFSPPGTSKLVRAQGCMCTDDEINDMVAFIKQQGQPAYETEIHKKIERPVSKLEEGEDDEMLSDAIDIIRETRRASTSSLQRRLRIGYTRAARIMDILEERGIIGPPRGSEPREILIDLDGEIPNNGPEVDADMEDMDVPEEEKPQSETTTDEPW